MNAYHPTKTITLQLVTTNGSKLSVTSLIAYTSKGSKILFSNTDKLDVLDALDNYANRFARKGYQVESLPDMVKSF